MSDFDFVTVDPMQVFETTVPHNGLAYLNAAWKEDGFRTRTVDMAKRPFPDGRWLRYCDKTPVFGVSVKTVTYERARLITQTFHMRALTLRVREKVKILWGGAHVTDRVDTDDPMLSNLPWVNDGVSKRAYLRMVSENPEVDEFVAGEAEYYPDHESRREALDDLPFPDYSDFDSFQQLRQSWRLGRLNYPLVTSRGCPYICSFCEVQRVSGRKWRYRSPSNCMDELSESWKRFRYRTFEVVDDEFNISLPRAKDFCSELLELKERGGVPEGLQWRCPNGLRADFYDAEFNDLLLKSGCGQVSFGVESLHPEVFAKIKKGETVDEIEATLRLCVDRGMPFFGHCIIGLPGSTFEKDAYTLSRLLDITDGGKRGYGTFSILQVMEGTAIAKLAAEVGYRDPTILDNAFFGENVRVAYWTDEYDAEERMDAYLLFNWMLRNGRAEEYYKSWKPEDARRDFSERAARNHERLEACIDEKWRGMLG